MFEEIGPDESRRCVERLGSEAEREAGDVDQLGEAAAPAKAAPAAAPGSVEELRAQDAALRKENRELARANAILQDAAGFFGAALDRQSKR